MRTIWQWIKPGCFGRPPFETIKDTTRCWLVSAPPAVINAIVDARHHRVGLRHIDKPATPRRIWEYLNTRRQARMAPACELSWDRGAHYLSTKVDELSITVHNDGRKSGALRYCARPRFDGGGSP